MTRQSAARLRRAADTMRRLTMAYATADSLYARAHPDNIVRWCDDDNDGVLCDEELATVDEAVADADAEIDARLGNRYAVPFDPVPRIIQRISCDLAIYYLAQRRGFVTADGGQSNLYLLNYRRALDLLEMLADGAASIPGLTFDASIVLTPGDAEPAVSRSQRDRVSGETLDEDIAGTLDDL